MDSAGIALCARLIQVCQADRHLAVLFSCTGDRQQEHKSGDQSSYPPEPTSKVPRSKDPQALGLPR